MLALCMNMVQEWYHRVLLVDRSMEFCDRIAFNSGFITLVCASHLIVQTLMFMIIAADFDIFAGDFYDGRHAT
jgi:hypothetical protein